jgi:hypothetical protein
MPPPLFLVVFLFFNFLTLFLIHRNKWIFKFRSIAKNAEVCCYNLYVDNFIFSVYAITTFMNNDSVVSSFPVSAWFQPLSHFYLQNME